MVAFTAAVISSSPWLWHVVFLNQHDLRRLLYSGHFPGGRLSELFDGIPALLDHACSALQDLGLIQRARLSIFFVLERRLWPWQVE